MRDERVRFEAITLLAAAGCNLQCSYCPLTRNVNKNSKQLLENTKKSFEDGSYLENVLKCFKRMEQSTKLIRKINFWGQEPTLVIPYFTKRWEEWYKTFPNLEEVFIPTNGIDMVEQIYDLAIAMDKFAKRRMMLCIQVSYDGKYGTDNVRGANADKIKENCLELNELFNNTNFNNLEVFISFHGVVSNSLIEYLNTFDKIDDYLYEIQTFLDDIHSRNISRYVHFTNITLQYENGTECTSEQGVRLADFVKKVELLRHKNKGRYRFFNNESFIFELLGGAGEIFEQNLIRSKVNSLDEYINFFINKKSDIVNELHKRSLYCGPGVAELKVTYDGTAVTCQNSIFDIYMDEEQLTDEVRDQARLAQMQHGHKINYITSTDEEILKYNTFINNTRKPCTQRFMIYNIANLMIMMARIGQIDPTYCYDFEKIKRHAFLLSNINCCYYNLVVNSASNIIRSAAEIRFLCNGILDMYEEALNAKYFGKAGKNKDDYRNFY